MRGKQAGFTLMELMVVIVIVAILAAVAVPLYINYVKDAQRTEAKGAIGAINTAEQVYYQKNGGTSYAKLEDLKSTNNIDISEAETKWTFDIKVIADGYDVTATSKVKGSEKPLVVCYNFTRKPTGGNPAGVFVDDCQPTPPPE